LIFQAQLAVGVRLFEAQCKQGGVSAGIENVGICNALSSMVQCILQSVGDSPDSRQLVTNIINDQAKKTSKPMIKSLVQNMIKPESVNAQLVEESSADKLAVSSNEHQVKREAEESAASAVGSF
jgi:hypothetical protein